MNNDQISRSALIAALENEIRIAVDKVKMFSLIEAAPAVDAVPAIRCLACDHYRPKAGSCTFRCGHRPPEHYCGEGKRRDKNE